MRRVLNLHKGVMREGLPRGKEGEGGDENSVHGDWEVKGKWQGCIVGPDGGELEAVEAREEWEVVGQAVLFCGQGLDSKRRGKKSEKGQG